MLLQGNPLSETSLNTHVPTLESWGVRVYFDAATAAIRGRKLAPWVLDVLTDGNASNPAIGKSRRAVLKMLHGPRADIERLDSRPAHADVPGSNAP